MKSKSVEEAFEELKQAIGRELVERVTRNLNGVTVGGQAARPKPTRRRMSAATRAKMAKAARLRWKKLKASQ